MYVCVCMCVRVCVWLLQLFSILSIIFHLIFCFLSLFFFSSYSALVAAPRCSCLSLSFNLISYFFFIYIYIYTSWFRSFLLFSFLIVLFASKRSSYHHLLYTFVTSFLSTFSPFLDPLVLGQFSPVFTFLFYFYLSSISD